MNNNKFKIGDLVQWQEKYERSSSKENKIWIGLVLKNDIIGGLRKEIWPLIYWFEKKYAYHCPPSNLEKIL